MAVSAQVREGLNWVAVSLTLDEYADIGPWDELRFERQNQRCTRERPSWRRQLHPPVRAILEHIAEPHARLRSPRRPPVLRPSASQSYSAWVPTGPNLPWSGRSLLCRSLLHRHTRRDTVGFPILILYPSFALVWGLLRPADRLSPQPPLPKAKNKKGTTKRGQIYFLCSVC